MRKHVKRYLFQVSGVCLVFTGLWFFGDRGSTFAVYLALLLVWCVGFGFGYINGIWDTGMDALTERLNKFRKRVEADAGQQ